MRKPENRPYYFRKRAVKKNIEVRFAHIPGRWFSTGTSNMTEAVLFAEERMKDDFHVKPAKIPTLSEYAKDFFIRTDPDSLQAMDIKYKRKRAPLYYKKQQAMLKNHILPRFGGYLITAISAKAIKNWLPEIRKIDGEDAADNTKNKILFAFRKVMEAVKDDGYRNDNPAEDVTAITAEQNEREAVPPEQLMILFPEDLEERIKVWHGIMWAVYFSIAYDTGWRHGEIAALRVSDVWVTQKGYYVTANRTLNHDANKILDRVKTSGKGLESRSGLLYDDTAELLLRYIDERKLSGDDLLFTGPRNGKPLWSETTNKHFKMVMKEHGFYHEGLVQYCLRHSYETDRRGDMPDSILAVSMGHTKLRDDYEHRTEKDMIRLLDRNRDSFFENRRRRGQDDEVISLDKLRRDKA